MRHVIDVRRLDADEDGKRGRGFGFHGRSRSTVAAQAWKSRLAVGPGLSTVGISTETLNGVCGATKAYVLGFSHSLQHELGDKGIRIQAVLPGATATEFWDIAGFAHQNMPKDMVMSAEDMVDAALAGLDQGERVTIPSLQDGQAWLSFEASRLAISKMLGNAIPGPRYNVSRKKAA